MQELGTQDFHGKIAKGKAVVDFWAPWCGPCKMMAPVFEEVSRAHKDTLFAKVNVDDHPQIAQEFGVRSIPTLIIFHDGKEVSRAIGASSKAQLESRIKEAFR